jgi:hypothetical protein
MPVVSDGDTCGGHVDEQSQLRDRGAPWLADRTVALNGLVLVGMGAMATSTSLASPPASNMVSRATSLTQGLPPEAIDQHANTPTA